MIPSREELDRIIHFVSELKRRNFAVSAIRMGDFILEGDDLDIARRVIGSNASEDKKPATFREAVAAARENK